MVPVKRELKWLSALDHDSRVWIAAREALLVVSEKKKGLDWTALAALDTENMTQMQLVDALSPFVHAYPDVVCEFYVIPKGVLSQHVPRGRFDGGFGMWRDPVRQEMFDVALRAGDVVINTVPKCGQTFIQTLLLSIKLKGDFDKIGGPKKGLILNSPWVEFLWPMEDPDGVLRPMTHEEVQAMLDEAPRPLLLKQHVNWGQICTSPDPEIQKTIKYISIIRDARDLPLSLFKHMHNHTDTFNAYAGYPPWPTDFDVFFDDMLATGRLGTGTLRGLWAHRNDDNVLLLHFHECVVDIEGTARKLIDFLGWEMPDDETMARIVSRADIGWVKKHQSEYLFAETIFHKNSFVREGLTGVNRKALSEEQEARLRAAYEKECPKDLVDALFRKK